MKKIIVMLTFFLSLILTESRAEVKTLDIYTLGSASGSYHRSNVLIKELLEQQGVKVGEVKVMNNCRNFNAIYDKINVPSIFLTDGLYQGQPEEVCDTPTSRKNVIAQRAMSVLLLCGQGVGADEFINPSNNIKVAFTKSMPAKKITSAWGEYLGKTITPVKYNSSGEISAALANGEVQYALTWTMHGLKSVRDSGLNCFAHTGPESLLALDGTSTIASYLDTPLKDMPFMGMSVYGWYEGIGMSNKEAKSLRKMMQNAIDSPEWNEHSFNARYFQVKHKEAYSWAKKNKEIWIELQN
jgi:hypothetical protein